jgi:hypothetical protein
MILTLERMDTSPQVAADRMSDHLCPKEEEGIGMANQTSGHAVADLAEAAAIQAEVTQQRMALEWGQLVFSYLLELWSQIESHEALAYEDKVAAQVCVLQEARSSLWHLHKEIAHTCRLLKDHRQQLKQLKGP